MCVVKCSACCSCFCSKCFMEMEGIFQDFFEKLKKKKDFPVKCWIPVNSPLFCSENP